MRRAGYFLTLALLLLFYQVAPSGFVMGAAVMLVLIPILSIGWLIVARKRVTVSMTAPSTCQKGAEASVCVQVRSRTPLPLGRVELNVAAENSVTGEKQFRKMTGSGRIMCRIKSEHCGCLYIQVRKVRLYDLFGLFWVNAPAPKELRVIVMPDTFPVMIQQALFAAPTDDCRDDPPNRKGQDRTETWQIRDYVPGDSLTQIHWKLSSKLNTLMVREPGMPVDQNLMVFVDRSWGEITPACADAIMEAAVSVCQSLCESALPFDLVWNEETIRTEHMTDQNMLPAAVGSLLKSKVPGNQLPGIDVYLGLYGSVNVSRLIYIGTAIPERMDEFVGESRVVSLLCGGADDEGVIGFDPDNYEQALAQVYWSE